MVHQCSCRFCGVLRIPPPSPGQLIQRRFHKRETRSLYGSGFFVLFETNGEPELIRLLHGVRYIGRVTVAADELLYFAKCADPNDVYKESLFALSVTSDMSFPVLPVTFDWAAENVWTDQFDSCSDSRIGPVAAVTTKLRHEPLPYRRHLAMSDDGSSWRFVHVLPNAE